MQGWGSWSARLLCSYVPVLNMSRNRVPLCMQAFTTQPSFRLRGVLHGIGTAIRESAGGASACLHTPPHASCAHPPADLVEVVPEGDNRGQLGGRALLLDGVCVLGCLRTVGGTGEWQGEAGWTVACGVLGCLRTVGGTGEW